MRGPTNELVVGAAQANPSLGDVDGNLEQHLAYIAQAREAGLDLLVFPELSLSGYALKEAVPDVAMHRSDARLLRLAAATGPMQTVLGFVEEAAPGEFYNALAILQDGALSAVHRKLNLPNYGGLEEGKLYGRGRHLTHSEIAPGWPATHLICADLWDPGLVHAAMLHRPNILVAPANSAAGAVGPQFSNEYHWVTNITFYAMTYGTPLIWANRYGWEGENFFWGGSRVMGPRGEVLAIADDEETLIRATLRREVIARARFDMPTIRDANAPLVRDLLREPRR